MLKKVTVFLIGIIFIMSGCSDKKESEDVNIKNLSKFDQILKEVKEYKRNITKTVSVTVQDGLYVKNGTVLNFYSFGKMEILTFDEKADLLEKVEAAPTTAIVSVADFAKTFYDYVTLEDLLKTGENASTKIGLTTSVYDLEKSSYTFANGFGIENPIIGTGGGTFSKAQTVTITCATSGVKIRYTTNGTEPTTSSTEYTTAIVISSTTTVKAKAFSTDGLVASSTVTAAYNINSATVTNGFLYAGKTYLGKTSVGTGIAKDRSDEWINITEPLVSTFDCDGYFELKGTYDGIYNLRYVYVDVTKKSTNESTEYFLEGTFNKKIWLRFGAGEYIIKVRPVNITTNVTIQEPFDGDIESYLVNGIIVWYNYTVNNTRDEDGRFLYPSNFIQSDDELITSTAKDVLTKANVLNGTAKEKAKALHDYVCGKLTYDDASLILSQRKKQDALTCLTTGLAVCEGYTSVYNALLRNQGIQAKAILGMDRTHAWTNAYDGTKWVLVDTTWDDQDSGMIYNYFWIDNLTKSNHTTNDERTYR